MTWLHKKYLYIYIYIYAFLGFFLEFLERLEKGNARHTLTTEAPLRCTLHAQTSARKALDFFLKEVWGVEG